METITIQTKLWDKLQKSKPHSDTAVICPEGTHLTFDNYAQVRDFLASLSAVRDAITTEVLKPFEMKINSEKELDKQ